MIRPLSPLVAIAALVSVACAETEPTVVLTARQQVAVQKSAEANLRIHAIVLTLRDAAGVEAAMPELCRCAAIRNIQSRHLRGAFRSRTEQRAVFAEFGWTEELEMESKYQLGRLASNGFYGSATLAAYYALPAEYARPVEPTPAASPSEELLLLLRTVHDTATADAAAPRVAELFAALSATGTTPQHIMAYAPEAESVVRELHGEFMSLQAVQFYGSAALKNIWHDVTPQE